MTALKFHITVQSKLKISLLLYALHKTLYIEVEKKAFLTSEKSSYSKRRWRMWSLFIIVNLRKRSSALVLFQDL